MVRTRESATVKVTGAKAPRKASFTPTASASEESGGKNKYSGGNSYCPRETPAWQKNITCFFANPTASSRNDNEDSKDSSQPSDGSPSKSVEEVPAPNGSKSSASNEEDSSNKENVAAGSSS